MRSLRSISVDILTTGELRGLVETYQEVAAGKMQTVRSETIQTREFTEGLARLSAAVGSDLTQAVGRKKPATAAVWMSANAGLFGDIIEKTLTVFLDYVKREHADAFVVGDAGKQLMTSVAPEIHTEQIRFPDDRIESESLRTLIARISGYEHVVIFFGKFKNIANQFPDQRTVSGELLKVTGNNINESVRQHREFIHIYEPSTESVSNLIAMEIQGSIIEQTIHESMLAKYASRLMHLDEAMDHIGEHITKLMTERRSVKKTRADRKQRIMLAGMRVRGGFV